jgi:hypothetical protein
MVDAELRAGLKLQQWNAATFHFIVSSYKIITWSLNTQTINFLRSRPAYQKNRTSRQYIS